MCDFLSEKSYVCPFSKIGAPIRYRTKNKNYCAIHAPRKSEPIDKININRGSEIQEISGMVASKKLKKIEIRGLKLDQGLDLNSLTCVHTSIKNSYIYGGISSKNPNLTSIEIINVSMPESANIDFRSNNNYENVLITKTKINSIIIIPRILQNITIDNIKSEQIIITQPKHLLQVVNSKISDEIKFMNISNCSENIKIENSSVKNNTNFSQLGKINNLHIANCKFDGDLDLRSVIFEMPPLLENSKFFGDVLFCKLTKDHINDTKTSLSGRKINNCTFYSHLDFSFCNVSDQMKFESVIFYKPPRFFGTNTHEDTTFSSCAFIDISSNSESAYRKLKQKMEEIRARDEESLFHSLELQCKINRLDSSVTFSAAVNLYGILSDYGRNFSNPLFFLLISTFFFSYYYMCIDGISSPNNFGDYVIFSINQVIRPFSAFYANPNSVYSGFLFPQNWNQFKFLYLVLCSIQSIFSISLVALFLLSLRWRFKRG